MFKSALIGIVKNTIRSVTLVGVLALPLTFSSCEPDVPVYSPPVGELSGSPSSGFAPLSVHVSYIATDKDDDITVYKLFVDGEPPVVKSTPFDTTIIFGVGTHTVNGEVYDSRGASDKSTYFTIHVTAVPRPVGMLDVSNVSGDSPFQTRLKLTGTPCCTPLKKYELHIDDKVFTKSTPFDTLVTLYAGLHQVYGEVIDGENKIGETDITPINVAIVPGEGAKWITGGGGYLFPFPKDPVNLFLYPGDSEYNSLTSKEERDNYIEHARATDITPTIPIGLEFIINGKVYGFKCVQVSYLFEYNCHDWKDLYTPYFSDPRVYGWYNGENIDSIHVHGGTIKFRDSHKLPIYTVGAAPGHTMNYAVTGDDLRDGRSINFVEMMYGVSGSNVQPGEKGIPLNYNGLILGFSYTYVKDGCTWYGSMPIAEYNIVNGVIQFVEINPNVEVVMTRNSK